jgi:hypothetical protein
MFWLPKQGHHLIESSESCRPLRIFQCPLAITINDDVFEIYGFTSHLKPRYLSVHQNQVICISSNFIAAFRSSVYLTMCQNNQQLVLWLNGRASDYESGGSRFDPWQDHFFCIFFCSSFPQHLFGDITRRAQSDPAEHSSTKMSHKLSGNYRQGALESCMRS